jgi:transposase
MDDHTFDPNAGELRRFEVITGTGRRRLWSAEAKARIVAESFAAGAQVSDVARRHGIRPQQLFGWRREARGGRLPLPEVGGPAFVPIVASVSAGAAPSGGPPAPTIEPAASCIEIELRGSVVRLRGRIETSTLAEVLAAVKSVT